MQNVYWSIYLRKKFEISDPTLAETLTLIAAYDDAFVCYINGTEVVRTGGMYYETDAADNGNRVSSLVNVPIEHDGLNIENDY